MSLASGGKQEAIWPLLLSCCQSVWEKPEIWISVWKVFQFATINNDFTVLEALCGLQLTDVGGQNLFSGPLVSYFWTLNIFSCWFCENGYLNSVRSQSTTRYQLLKLEPLLGFLASCLVLLVLRLPDLFRMRSPLKNDINF